VGWGIPEERVTVIPNATPPLGATGTGTFGVEGPLLAFAGRLTAAKQLDVALAAVRDLPVTLLVAGDGELRGELEASAPANVRFLGAQSRARVLELFAAADLVVLSSAWENFPHALVEALALGTPVVATAVGGVPEIVRDGENGVLVPPGDPAAFAAAIGRALGDESLRANAKGSVARFSPDVVHTELEQVLRTVAS
jgi:glycogen synthase